MNFLGIYMKTALISAAAFAMLTGCATSTTGAVPRGEGMNTITRQGSGFWVSTDSLKTAAMLEADAHCQRAGKNVKILYSKEIQAGGGRFPEAEILFKCE